MTMTVVGIKKEGLRREGDDSVNDDDDDDDSGDDDDNDDDGDDDNCGSSDGGDDDDMIMMIMLMIMMMMMMMALRIVARQMKKSGKGGTTPGMKLPSRKSPLQHARPGLVQALGIISKTSREKAGSRYPITGMYVSWCRFLCSFLVLVSSSRVTRVTCRSVSTHYRSGGTRLIDAKRINEPLEPAALARGRPS